MDLGRIGCWCLAFAFGLGQFSSAHACPFDDPNAPRWNPLGCEAYLRTSFADPRGTSPYPGIEFRATPGQKVQAPEDGEIVELRDAKDGSGKELLFKGLSGHVWLYGHLSGYGSKRTGIKEYEPIAYASNTFHLEIHDPTGKQTLNPCEVGLACYDSVPPRAVRAVVWDAANASARPRITGNQALAAGCLEVDPEFHEPRMALQLVDYAVLPAKERMGVYSIVVRQGSSIYYQRNARSYALPADQVFVEEYLQSFAADSLGFWYSLVPTGAVNENVRGKAAELGQFLRQVAGLSDGKAADQYLKLELQDQRLNGNLLRLVARPSCSPSVSIPAPSSPDSLVYTFLSRPWLQMGVCTQGVNVSLLDSNKQIIERSLCDSLAPQPIAVTALLARYPTARTLVFGGKLAKPRSIEISPQVPLLVWKQNGLTLRVQTARPSFVNALAWEVVDDRKGAKSVQLYPQGIQMRVQVSHD